MSEPEVITEQFNRRLPAIFAGGSIVILVFYHWYAMSAGRVYFFISFGIPMVTGLALGGLIYPPIFFGLGPRGAHLPKRIKALSVLFALSGLAFALCVARFVYHM